MHSIAVTPPDHDDVGSILREMDYDFSFVTQVQLEESRTLDACDILFINCAEWCRDANDGVIANVRKFVQEGGVLYASDFAAHIIRRAFGDRMKFEDDTIKQPSMAKVVNCDLRKIIGRTIGLHLDKDHWFEVCEILDDSVNVYLRGDYLESDGKRKPLVASFEEGRGFVIYTAFHTSTKPERSKNSSGAHQKLLKFLALKPIAVQRGTEFALVYQETRKGTR